MLQLTHNLALDLSGQLSDSWQLEEHTQGKVDSEGLRRSHDELRPHHRIAALQEEVVVYPDSLEVQESCYHSGQSLFDWRSRCRRYCIAECVGCVRHRESSA